MATTKERPRVEQAEPDSLNGSQPDAPEQEWKPSPDAPYLGRSVEMVGDWNPIKASENPHEKNKRGELGKPLFNWYFNRTSKDPLGRISFIQSAADKKNVAFFAVGQAPKGKVNEDKVKETNPKALTKHLKRVAHYMGADIVGIAPTHPSLLYSDGAEVDNLGSVPGLQQKNEVEAGASIPQRYPYAIVITVAWDYDKIQAHRHHIGDHAYHFSQAKLGAIYENLVRYIKEMGYSAVRNLAQPMPTALSAGLGEMGRNGILITEKYGARIHLSSPILTDMPLLTDKPIDIGVSDFCQRCRKCATTCPTNSITMEDKVVHNGIKKYKLNWETCYRLRAYVMDFWEVCMSCVTICPYTKPRRWWHNLAIQSLKRTPVPLRAGIVWPLKWIDDKFWGTVPKKRVKWLDYDTAVYHGKNGKGPNGNDAHETPDPKSKVGYYHPLKENTRRFELLKEREEKAAGKAK